MESTGSTGTPPPDEAPVPEAPPPPPPAEVAPPPAAAGAAPPPAAAGAPAAASSMPGWMNTVTSTQTVAGPAGMTYADVPARIFAYIIDAIIMAVAFGILYSIFVALFLGSALGGFGFMSFVWFVVLVLIYAAGSAIYFIYTWTKMRGSPGQRVLGLETLNAADGSARSPRQSALALPVRPVRRWHGGQPCSEPRGDASLLRSGYAIYLLHTAANSPTRRASTTSGRLRRGQGQR
jgi:hypothetical protein